ncbi:hypothetical protein AM587_10001427 [Phytophthora nicotianae]|nr:hypothetical protein AM587_10001427 [Phytophthora nicotianae]
MPRRYSIMKLLLLVAVLSYTSVASMFHEVVRIPQPPVARNMESTTPRLLRSESIKTTDEQTNAMEERVPAMGLDQVGKIPLMSKIVQNIKLQLGKQSPADAFKILQLDQTGINLFKSPRFIKWIEFVKNTNKNNPELAIFTTLASRYSDDAMAKMFAAAKEIDETKAVATKLEEIQLTKWISTNKSPRDVFNILELERMGSQGLASPQFSRWTDFITKANPTDSEAVIYTRLRVHYNDEALAKMFAAAKEIDSANALVSKLEGIQLAKWESARSSGDYVFKVLNLDKTDIQLFKSPILNTWAAYIARIHPDNPSEVIFAKLATLFKDVSARSEMIQAATMAPSTKKLASDVRLVQFRHWLDEGLTPKQLNAMLGVSNTDNLTKKLSNSYRKFYWRAKKVLE